MAFTLPELAEAFATGAHLGQTHKYTGEPYIEHPRAVAFMVWEEADATPPVIAAAWLHDVVEDCGVEPTELVRLFGGEVTKLVMEVTDVSRPEDGNRRTRKAMDRDHLAKASPGGMTIKLADIIDNTQSIVERDPDFAPVYLREKRELLPLLTRGHPVLWERANALVNPTKD